MTLFLTTQPFGKKLILPTFRLDTLVLLLAMKLTCGTSISSYIKVHYFIEVV